MIAIVLVMFGILALSGAIVMYVAYPHRGADVPRAQWIGAALARGVDRFRTIEDGELDREGAAR